MGTPGFAFLRSTLARVVGIGLAVGVAASCSDRGGSQTTVAAQPQATPVATPAPAATPTPEPTPAAGSVPVMVEAMPWIGATDVDPSLNEIVVKFSTDMGGGFSWTGGGENYPEVTAKPFWRDARTCVLPVNLEPGKFYRVGINSKSYKNFRSKEGVPALPTAVYFTTRGAPQATVQALSRPAVVSMTPANGATNVSPSLTELRITFNQEMGGGFSWTGGGPNFPETTGRPHWTPDRRTCILPVKLKPNWSYRLGLNSPSHKNFQSARGVPLDPVRYTFQTGSQ